MTAELAALLLADARLPIGSHAHSAGLEAALAAGMDPTLVPQYIDARLRTVGLVEAAAAVLTRRVADAGADEVLAVQESLLARTPSEPLRTASMLLGRGLARLAGRLWPDHPGNAALDALPGPPMRPVALGVLAAAAGLEDARVARACLYDDAQTVAAAALKLLPVDPIEATGWVLAAAPTVVDVVTRSVAVRTTLDLPAVTAPQVELWSLEHDARTRRLFVA